MGFGLFEAIGGGASGSSLGAVSAFILTGDLPASCGGGFGSGTVVVFLFAGVKPREGPTILGFGEEWNLFQKRVTRLMYVGKVSSNLDFVMNRRHFQVIYSSSIG